MALRALRTAIASLGPFALLVVLQSGGSGAGAATSAPSTPSASTSTTTPATTTTAPAVPVLRADATVTIAVSHLPSELNPWAAGGSDPIASEIMAQVWPQASIVDGNGNSTICFAEVTNCPEALFTTAEDVSVQPQTIDYSINPKAKWSDGTPVTATDFIALWHAVVANAGFLPVTEPIAGYLDISSITPSDHGEKFAVVFHAPYADWPALFTDVPPAHVSAKLGFAAAYSARKTAQIPSAGPYRISRFIPDKVVILDRNPGSWGARPIVKRIIFRVYPNEAQILAGLASGSITVAELSPSPAVAAAVGANDELTTEQASEPELWQLAFNVARPDLTPAPVRQAIAKVINRQEVIADAIGLQMPFGQAAGNRLFPSGAPGSQGNGGGYGAVDLDEATDLLASVGDTTDADGFVDTPAGKRMRLRLAVPAGDAVLGAAAATIQAELLVAGITVTVQPVRLATLLGSTLPRGEYDLALVPFPVSPYPSTTASLYLDPIGPTPPPGANPTAQAPATAPGSSGSTTTSSTTTTTTTPTTPAIGTTAAPLVLPVTGPSEPASLALGTVTRNILGFDDPAIASLYAQASTELNTASELSIYDEIDTTLWADMATLPLYQQPILFVHRIAMLNLSQSASPSQYLWNAENWAIEENPTPPTTTTAP